MEFNFWELRDRIHDIYGSQMNFAKALNVSQAMVSARLVGRTAFTAEDIVRWSDALNIPLEETSNYFLRRKNKR